MGPRILKMNSQTIKWLSFSGNAEEYPAWNTKLTAFMQTKGFFKSLLGKEFIPQEITPLSAEATAEQINEWHAKEEERKKEIEAINE